jgi:hypothetical protein
VPTREFFGYHWRWLGKWGKPPGLSTQMAVRLAETVAGAAKAFGKASEMGRGTVELLARSGGYKIDKAATMLGYRPKVALADGMGACEQHLRDTGVLKAKRKGGT